MTVDESAVTHRPRDLDAALDRAEDAPEKLGRHDAETLLLARSPDLTRLLGLAGRLRDIGLQDAGRPGMITYSRKVFIPLTRLCQDRCHYCVFAQAPAQLERAGLTPFMSAEEILSVARRGAAMGCKEALFTLGDRPENRWPAARTWLDEHGYTSTLEYVGAMAHLVLEETGLLPHLNPGVMSWAELQRLKPYAPSMGMMLETTSRRLWAEKGEAHYGSPDKDPDVRLAVIEAAGRSRVPFTTGVLLGIGETPAERIDAVLALREAHARHGHLQEIIVQNFRAKPKTAMTSVPDLQTQEYAAAVAVSRILLGPGIRLQAPPNLTDEAELSLLVRAGIDDWGGVSPLTPDHVNPERPWPQVDELARLTQHEGYQLRERLTAHPHYLRETREGADWIDDRLRDRVLALADDYGLARVDARLGEFPASPPQQCSPSPSYARLLAKAGDEPSGLTDAEYAELLRADGADLETLTALADEVRRTRVGDVVTYAVNRNLDSSGDLPLSRITELTAEAAALGATEICAQGAVPAERGAEGYLAFAAAVKAGDPAVHLHAFRPVEVADGARRAAVPPAEWLLRLRESGVDTVPGTGARILDDEVRARLTNGTDIPAAEWTTIITSAHRVGLRSTATMVYGHLESPLDQVRHLRALARIQDETGGFTELITMPWLPIESPVPVAGARPGPDLRETRAVHAVARLMLDGRIDHIQAAWTKLGMRGAQVVLAGGADDMGGLLLDGVLDPDAGPETGRELTPQDVTRLAGELGRSVRQRTTTYGEVRASA